MHRNDDLVTSVDEFLGVAPQVLKQRHLPLDEPPEAFATVKGPLQDAHLNHDAQSAIGRAKSWRLVASNCSRTISTFSRDISYSRSPTAARAFALLS